MIGTTRGYRCGTMWQSVWYVAVAFVAAFTYSAWCHAGEEFELVQTLVPRETVTLEITPSGFALSDDRLFVYGKREDGHALLALDADTLGVLAKRELDFRPEDVVVSADGETLVVTGKANELSGIYTFDPDLANVGELMLPWQLAEPASFLSFHRRLSLGGRRVAKSEGDIFIVDVSDPASPVPSDALRIPTRLKGLANLWLADGEGIIFVNSAAKASLFAVDLKSGYPVDGISYQYAKNEETQPFSAFGVMDDLSCRSGQGATFLVADNQNGALMLVDYDRLFRKLNIQATIAFRTRLVPRAVAERISGESVFRPAALLASSCDQSVIWMGNIYSEQIIQFARNPDSSALERVGTIKLNFRPNELVISKDATFALAIAREHKTVVRFERAEETGSALGIIGNESVREVQRLLFKMGYPVGSIDGIIGKKTRRAIDLVESRYSIKLNLAKDLKGALETLRSTLRR